MAVMPGMEYNGKILAGARGTWCLFTMMYWPPSSGPSYFHVRACGVTAKTPSSSRCLARQADQVFVQTGQSGQACTGSNTCLQSRSLTRPVAGSKSKGSSGYRLSSVATVFSCVGGPEHHGLRSVSPKLHLNFVRSSFLNFS